MSARSEPEGIEHVVTSPLGFRYVCRPGCGWSGHSHYTEGGNPILDIDAALKDGERHLREAAIHTLDLRQPEPSPE